MNPCLCNNCVLDVEASGRDRWVHCLNRLSRGEYGLFANLWHPPLWERGSHGDVIWGPVEDVPEASHITLWQFAPPNFDLTAPPTCTLEEWRRPFDAGTQKDD